MPSGLDTGIPAIHYLARRISTPGNPELGRSVGMILGELPATALIQSVQMLITAAWTGGNLQFSKTPDLSNPFFAIGGLNVLGVVGAVNLLPAEQAFLQTGKIYIGSNGAVTGTGSGIVQIRYFPRIDPLGFG